MTDWKQLAADRRPVEGGVLHPDDCVVIRIKGAEWSVRPLQLPCGIMYTPEFGEVVRLRQTVDPLGNKPMQDRAAELVLFLNSEQEDPFAKVTAACAYLGELFDQQYNLSDELKADLLSFRGDTLPAWYDQTVRHAHGLEPMVADEEFLDSIMPEPIEVAQPAKKHWWNFR